MASFWERCGTGVNSASNKNEYQEYFAAGKGGWYVGLTTLPPSCGDCHEICEPQPLGTLGACPGLYRDCFTFMLLVYKCNLVHFHVSIAHHSKLLLLLHFLLNTVH